MSGLFNRSVALEVGVAGAPGKQFTGLRIGFGVDHTKGREPNKATIQVYNLAPPTIALLQVPGVVVRLLVGYGDPAIPRQIFMGNPVKNGIRQQTQGPDRIMQIEAADGGAAYQSTHLALSFATGTTYVQILTAVLGATQWARGVVTINEAAQLPHGVVLTGRPAEILDRIAATVPPLGADWWIEDGVFYCAPKGQPVPSVAPLISATQGNLIGSPSPTDKGLEVTALIDASMRPGRTFVVESRQFNGTYIADSVSFSGDSGFENDFTMRILGKPVGVP